MSKILSISIAAYNVEKFLQKTLDSFIEPSIMNDIEVLIINDGSKDRTAEIAAEYEEKYSDTFKLIDKPNGGHGSTINAGLKNATGKYFKIVDGDDWVNTKNMPEFISILKNSESDIIATNYVEVDDTTMGETPRNFKGIEYNKEYKYDDTLKVTELCMHQLAIKTDILKKNNIILDEHCFYVDAEFIILPIPFINTITFINLPIYMYRLGLVTQSVSAAGKRKHIEDHVRVTKRLVEFAESSIVNSLNAEKRLYIKWFASKLVRTTIGIYLSFPFRDNSIRSKLVDFDNAIKNLSAEVYNYSQTTISFPIEIRSDMIILPEKTIGDKRINLLRKTNFFGWRSSQLLVNIVKKN